MWKNVVFITARFFWGDGGPARSICWAFVKPSRTPVAEKRGTRLACTPHLSPPPLFPRTKCLHVHPPLHLPPFLSHHPLHPYSSLLVTGSWVVEEGSIVRCFGFPWFKSSSQSRWEGTGEASRHLWAGKGAVEVLNGLRASRGPR